MRIVLNIPDEVSELVVETFAKGHGWRSEALDGPAGAYAGQRLIDSIMSVLRGQWGDTAAAAARQEAIDQVNRNVIITLNGEAP